MAHPKNIKENYYKVEMDFDDQLPCGGYEKEDQEIKQAIEDISLGKESKQVNGEKC